MATPPYPLALRPGQPPFFLQDDEGGVGLGLGLGLGLGVGDGPPHLGSLP